MSYEDFAKNEFRALGWIDKEGRYVDKMQQYTCEQVLELLALFSEHEHSGSSVSYAINLFKKLALFKPLSPLTGEDWEWQECFAGGLLQNKRCPRVFKAANGKAYDIEGYVFSDGYTNSRWVSGESRKYITFPYAPSEPEHKVCWRSAAEYWLENFYNGIPIRSVI